MKYLVKKKTMTYADTLEAVGLADLLGELTGSNIRLQDLGDSYSLELKEAIKPENWLPPERTV